MYFPEKFDVLKVIGVQKNKHEAVTSAAEKHAEMSEITWEYGLNWFWS